MQQPWILPSPCLLPRRVPPSRRLIHQRILLPPSPHMRPLPRRCAIPHLLCRHVYEGASRGLSCQAGESVIGSGGRPRPPEWAAGGPGPYSCRPAGVPGGHSGGLKTGGTEGPSAPNCRPPQLPVTPKLPSELSLELSVVTAQVLWLSKRRLPKGTGLIPQPSLCSCNGAIS
jgi:hypothetical protein